MFENVWVLIVEKCGEIFIKIVYIVVECCGVDRWKWYDDLIFWMIIFCSCLCLVENDYFWKCICVDRFKEFYFMLLDDIYGLFM